MKTYVKHVLLVFAACISIGLMAPQDAEAADTYIGEWDGYQVYFDPDTLMGSQYQFATIWGVKFVQDGSTAASALVKFMNEGGTWWTSTMLDTSGPEPDHLLANDGFAQMVFNAAWPYVQ